MDVDHVLPRKLLHRLPELQRIRDEYGLPPRFQVEGYSNWIPCHRKCNLEKGEAVFDQTRAHFFLHVAEKKSGSATKVEGQVLRNEKAGRLLATLQVGLQEGLIDKRKVEDMLRESARTLTLRYDPLVVTFGTNVSELLEGDVLPTEVPSYYPELCDWLEADLMRQVKHLARCKFYYPEDSARNGETLSVRLAFIGLDLNNLNGFRSSWWEILEVAYYSDVYGDSAEK
jgi:hypothetical protein